MKKTIHPTRYPVVFADSSCGAEFITTSTLKSEETRAIGGVDHFVIPIEISSASHPFFTGKHRFVDVGGRVDKYKERVKEAEEKAATRKGKKVKHAARAKVKQKDLEKAETKKKIKKEKKEEDTATAAQ